MWNNRSLRVLGAIFALTLLATACGSDDAATDTAALDDSMTDEGMSEMADDEHADDHSGDHSDDDHGDDHGAKTIDVDPNKPIPEVAVIMTESEEAGVFDMRVVLANFTITPENVDGDPVDNEGHMHLLIDGEKVERFYELERQVLVPEGEHLVEVELNANNHSAYAIDGQPIRTGMTVIGAGTASGHDHDDASGAIESGLTAADADVTITASFEGGEVTLDGDDRVEVAVDDVVMVMISSDVVDEAHVHGYDILADAGPGADGMILFTADTPGRFEIELEQSGAFIAELVVA